jgi:hypothetical protein
VDTLGIVLLVAIPFAGIAILAALLNRWGSRRDPMGGSAKDLWRTNGGPPRSDADRD